MRTIAFVCPLVRQGSLRFLRALLEQPDCRIALIGLESADRIPAPERERLAGHWQVGDCMDPEALVAAVRGLEHNGSTRIERLVSFLEELQVPVADARQALGLPGLHGEAARDFRDKDRMKRVLRAAGVPVARSALVHSLAEARTFAELVGYPLVVKPPEGLGARATWRVADEAALDAALQRLSPSATRPVQAEEFVVGEEFTMETVMIGGQPVWRSWSRYHPTPLQVLEHGWMQYTVLLPREVDDPRFTRFFATNLAALRALGLHDGISHMEWFLRPDGTAMVSEVGARPPGAKIMDLMSLAHDSDLWAAWAGLVCHERFEPLPRVAAAGVAFFRAQGGGDRITAVTGLEEAQQDVGEWVVDRQLPVVGAVPSAGYEGDGWAIVRHAETDGAARALARLVRTVRVVRG
jgi:ATP-grasp domain